jgi:hypothetical protein
VPRCYPFLGFLGELMKYPPSQKKQYVNDENDGKRQINLQSPDCVLFTLTDKDKVEQNDREWQGEPCFFRKNGAEEGTSGPQEKEKFSSSFFE